MKLIHWRSCLLMPSIWDPLPIDGEKSDSTMLIVSITHQLQARQPRTVFCTKCCCTAVLRHPRIQNCFQKNTTAFMPPAMVCMVIHFHCYCWLPLLTEFLRLYQEQLTASSSNSNLWLLLLFFIQVISWLLPHLVLHE